ncbi:tetratricopeptide repeat protein [Spartinivicinus poritis]|uniref:Tetratricopeptide repeat protein n=1 Tax=Spartinivicinus poritis TaxID=2994640 RepID=A0ABT5U406_9GAMM|nr:hypothetical protein [Spartinivicinus sp. A2-2]MDE1460950.1 hypothetical protein [Spartinivicinus sp. A2-2]
MSEFYQMPDEIRGQMIQIAFAGVESGQGKKSKIIFDCIKEIYPTSAAGDVGYALIEVYNGNYNKAINLLSKTIKQSSNCLEEARVILLFAMIMSGKKSEAKFKLNDFEKNELMNSEMIEFTKSFIGSV